LERARLEPELGHVVREAHRREDVVVLVAHRDDVDDEDVPAARDLEALLFAAESLAIDDLGELLVMRRDELAEQEALGIFGDADRLEERPAAGLDAAKIVIDEKDGRARRVLDRGAVEPLAAAERVIALHVARDVTGRGSDTRRGAGLVAHDGAHALEPAP